MFHWRTPRPFRSHTRLAVHAAISIGLAFAAVSAKADDDDDAPKAAAKPAAKAPVGEPGVVIAPDGAGPAVLTLGSNGESGVFRGSFQDGKSPLSLRKIGTGTVTLIGPGKYSGGLTIDEGTVALGLDGDGSENPTALGTGTVTLKNGASLRLGGKNGRADEDEETIPNNVQIDHGSLVGYAGTQRFTGRVTIGGGGGAFFVTHSGDISFDGDVTGTGPISIDSDDTGAGGTIRITNDLSYMGALTIRPPSPGFSGGRISIEDPEALNQATLVTAAGMRGVAFKPQKKPYTIGALIGTGGIDLQGCKVYAGVLATESLYSGNLTDSTGDGEFAKVGSGTMTLTGAHDYTGRMGVYNGTLVITGSVTAEIKVGDPKIPLSVATLRGTGSVNDLLLQTPGAAVQPGPDAIHTGTLKARNFSMIPGSNLLVRLGGTTPGAGQAGDGSNGYDQISATGQFSLSGNLQVSLINGFRPKRGDAFYVLVTSGPVQAVGHFGNVIGDEIETAGHRFRLTYTADHAANDPHSMTGHDVALIALSD